MISFGGVMTGFPSHPCRDALIPVVLAFDCKYSEIVDEKQIIEEKTTL